jgi:hypothetical protein
MPREVLLVFRDGRRKTHRVEHPQSTIINYNDETGFHRFRPTDKTDTETRQVYEEELTDNEPKG